MANAADTHLVSGECRCHGDDLIDRLCLQGDGGDLIDRLCRHGEGGDLIDRLC